MAKWKNSGTVKFKDACRFLLKKITPIVISTSVLFFKNIDVAAQSSPAKNNYQTFLYYYLENGKKVPLHFKQNIERFNNNRKNDSMICNNKFNNVSILNYCIEFPVPKPIEITDSMAALLIQTSDTIQAIATYQLTSNEPIKTLDVISCITGKKINCITANKNELVNKLTIDVKCLANGFYTCIAKTNTNKTYYGKLAKQ